MKDFSGRTAAITGGASGIGLAIAKSALQRGMNVAIADVEAAAIDKALSELGHADRVLAVQTDVSKADDMDAFADQTLARFGAVHMVVNNAGVDGQGPMWELETKDWEWTLGPNLWGVIHGVRVFAKHLVAQNEGHIINTGSIAGLVSAPGLGPYTVSKHAVVALSESLFGELRNEGKDVGVSVLCPSYVNTNIYRAARNHPDYIDSAEKQAELEQISEIAQEFFADALSAQDVSDMVFTAVEEKQFYILPHPIQSKELIRERMEEILGGQNPSLSGSERFPTH